MKDVPALLEFSTPAPGCRARTGREPKRSMTAVAPAPFGNVRQPRRDWETGTCYFLNFNLARREDSVQRPARRSFLTPSLPCDLPFTSTSSSRLRTTMGGLLLTQRFTRSRCSSLPSSAASLAAATSMAPGDLRHRVNSCAIDRCSTRSRSMRKQHSRTSRKSTATSDGSSARRRRSWSSFRPARLHSDESIPLSRCGTGATPCEEPCTPSLCAQSLRSTIAETRSGPISFFLAECPCSQLLDDRCPKSCTT
jgi:hypothetical protein